MATSRAQLLSNMTMGMPEANEQFAKGQQAAQTLQMQAALAGARGPLSGQQIANVATQRQVAANQLAAQMTERTQGALASGANQALAAQEAAAAESAQEQKIALTQNQRQFSRRLGTLNSRMRRELLDSQLEFKRDEAGRTLFNTRQAVDWAITNAKNEEEYRQYQQSAEQVYEKELYILKMADKKISQALSQGYKKRGQQLDNAQRIELSRQKQALEAEIKRKEARARNRATMWSQGLKVAGTVAGAVGLAPILGPAGGAVVGAALGEAAGSAIASETNY